MLISVFVLINLYIYKGACNMNLAFWAIDNFSEQTCCYWLLISATSYITVTTVSRGNHFQWIILLSMSINPLATIIYVSFFITYIIVTVTSLQKMAISSNLQKVPVGMHVTSWAKFTLASPATYVTSKRIVFVIDINLVHSYMTSQICC